MPSASVASSEFKPGPMGDSGLGQLAYDKNWIVCDNGAASPYAGRCYTVWTDIPTDGSAFTIGCDGAGGTCGLVRRRRFQSIRIKQRRGCS